MALVNTLLCPPPKENAFPLRFRQFPAGDPRIHGFSPFGVGYVCSGPCLAAGLVTGFGMACFCPCLKMIRGVMP
ncbi:hypothetical protein SAMN05660745_01644, partial [Corynebacterium glucuronolyticum]